MSLRARVDSFLNDAPPARFASLRRESARILAFPLGQRLVQFEDSEETASARWQRLMLAAQGGDQRCYAIFLREAAIFVRVIVRRFHSDTTAIEDVVQETLVSVHRVRHTYEPGRPVEPWVAAIARARAIDALRARKRRAAFEQAMPADLADVAAPVEDKVALEPQIIVALEALPASQQAAVRMVKLEDMSLAEAAQASGQSVSAVKSLLHRAMTAMRASLRGNSDA